MGKISHYNNLLLLAVALAVSLMLSLTSGVCADDLIGSQTFAPETIIISVEGGMGRFNDRLPGSGLQVWDLAARFSLLPFAPFELPAFAEALDGALEVGVEPIFERFSTQQQNFGGAGLALRYYLMHFRYGRFVPWMNVMAAPGGTDLRVGPPALEGPFMFVIHAGLGVSYFIKDRLAVYVGYQAQHVSNAGTYGADLGLDSYAGAVFGVTYFMPSAAANLW